jgi:hypothetical protein
MEKFSFKIGFLQKRILESWSEKIRARLPGVELREEKQIPEFQKYENPDDASDAFVINVDSSAMEDINLISNTLYSGHFGFSKVERAQWLADYTATTDSKDRLNKLRKIHFESLYNATVTPLVEFPFIAIARKNWKMEFSSISVSNPFWKIQSE